MLSFSSLMASANVFFRGSSESSGPGVIPVSATLNRPDGLRHYLIAEPSGKSVTGGRALVILLHGAGASASQVLGLTFPPSPLSLWLEIAMREQLVVIAPDAGKGGWTDCFASVERMKKKDDVGFIGALMDLAIADYNVAPEQIYLVGVSRGGWMAYSVANRLPERLAAFSVVLAGMPPIGRAKMPTKPLSALIFGCTADPLIRYSGGKPWYALWFAEPVRSIEDTVHAWRELAGLSDTPNVTQFAINDKHSRTSVTSFIWGEQSDAIQVGLYRIDGAGHAEPSRLKRYPRFINWLTGLQNADLEVAEATWDFFRTKRCKPQDSSVSLPANELFINSTTKET